MAADASNGSIIAVLNRLREQGFEPADATPSDPLPPITADPSWVFERHGDQGPKMSLLTRLRGILLLKDAPQIARGGPGDSPSLKDAVE